MKKATHTACLSSYINLSEAIDEARIRIRNYRNIGIELTVRIYSNNTRSGFARCIKIVK